LAMLQGERPQGVVADIRDESIQHAQPNGNALAGDLVNHRLHMFGSHFTPVNLIVYAIICLSRASPWFFRRESESGRGSSGESVTDSCRELAVQWLSDLPLKRATGFEPPIVQRRKRLRQLIWNIGP